MELFKDGLNKDKVKKKSFEIIYYVNCTKIIINVVDYIAGIEKSSEAQSKKKKRNK